MARAKAQGKPVGRPRRAVTTSTSRLLLICRASGGCGAGCVEVVCGEMALSTRLARTGAAAVRNSSEIRHPHDSARCPQPPPFGRHRREAYDTVLPLRSPGRVVDRATAAAHTWLGFTGGEGYAPTLRRRSFLLSLPAGCVDDKAPAPLGPVRQPTARDLHVYGGDQPLLRIPRSWTYRADITQSAGTLRYSFGRRMCQSLRVGHLAGVFRACLPWPRQPDASVLSHPAQRLFDSPEVCFGFPTNKSGPAKRVGSMLTDESRRLRWRGLVKDKSCYASDIR